MDNEDRTEYQVLVFPQGNKVYEETERKLGTGDGDYRDPAGLAGTARP
jgi:hypothetical protein